MSTMLYEGSRVTLTRYAGPAAGGPDRRRYQLMLVLPRAGMGEGTPVAAAWIVLTRAELRQIAEAIHGAESTERWSGKDPNGAPKDDKPPKDEPDPRQPGPNAC